MKILMILGGEFPPDIRVENEALALLESGHEVTIACQTRSGKAVSETYKGIRILRKPIPQIVYKSSVGCLKFPVYFNFWKNFLQKVFSGNSFDAIHVHDLPLASVGIRFGKKLNIPVILDLHENWPAMLLTAEHTNSMLGRLLSSEQQWRKYEKEMTLEADRIITVVEEMKDRIIALGNDPEKITVVSNTANIPQLKLDPALLPDPRYRTLIYAGGLTFHRGLQVIIKGLREIRESIPHIRLWLVGEGRYRESLMELASREGVSNLVEFKGYQPFDIMFALVQQSDAALIPHLRSEQNDNSSPNKIFQYMYASKPVISSNCTSLQRVITETGAGITYKDTDPHDFATATVTLLSDPELHTSAGKKGHEAVINRYNWDITKLNLLNLYRIYNKS